MQSAFKNLLVAQQYLAGKVNVEDLGRLSEPRDVGRNGRKQRDLLLEQRHLVLTVACDVRSGAWITKEKRFSATQRMAGWCAERPAAAVRLTAHGYSLSSR